MSLLPARRAAIAHPRAGFAPGCTCLLCTFVPVHTPCPKPTHENELSGRWMITHVFPTKSGTTFAAVYVPNSVITSSHGTVIRLSFDDVDTTVTYTLRRLVVEMAIWLLTLRQRGMLFHVVH